MMGLTPTAHLHAPTDLCPTLFLCNPASIFGSLETVFETLVGYLPIAGFTKINSYLDSLPLVSLPLDSVSVRWPYVFCLGPPEPDALSALNPSYILPFKDVNPNKLALHS